MDYLLVTTGSAGDIFPFVALGRGLAALGRRVTLAAPAEFRACIERSGLSFLLLDEELTPAPPRFASLGRILRRMTHELLRPITAKWRKLARSSTVIPMLRPTYDLIARHHLPGRTVVISSTPLLGARIAQDHLGVPLVTVHLSPAYLRSVHQPTPVPSLFRRTTRRLRYRLLDALVLDPLLAGSVNRLRAEVGLSGVQRVLDRWRHSPRLVLGLFPPWLALPQPDWPAAIHLPGFLYYDGADASNPGAGVQTFLDGDRPLVVFTPGSAIRRAHRFFQESVRSCQQLGCRGLLLTRYRDQVPAVLPEGIVHQDYLPLSQVLPRAAALVHTGGIGTAAQALAAGVPQLVMPIKNDQPVNARLLAGLGVARVLPPRLFRSPAVVNELAALLGPAPARTSCRELARQIDPVQSLATACARIEALRP